MSTAKFRQVVERGCFSGGGRKNSSPLPAKNFSHKLELERQDSGVAKGIKDRLIAIEDRMNSSNAFWLNFRKIDTGVRIDGKKRCLLQILINGNDAIVTDELGDFLKNAAGDMLYMIKAYRTLRTQLAEERREAKTILRELRDEIEHLKR